MALKLGVLTALVIATLVALAVAGQPSMPQQSSQVQVGDTTIAVEVADTPDERERGLSGRDSLTAGEGLLFDFGTPGTWGIWMKDMRFAIDIVWANERVVTVAHNISPATYPQIFEPKRPARYVLELPAGYAAAHGIAEGAEFKVE